MTKVFLTPFAKNGDVEEIPDRDQTGGDVSFEKGYTFDYERDPTTDPMARDIERKKMNWLFGALTEAAGAFQTVGTFPYITPDLNGGEPYPYVKSARVLYNGTIYESLVDANTALPTDATKWRDTTHTEVDLSGYVPVDRRLTVSAPLQGGGDLSADRTLSILAAAESQSGAVQLATAAESTAGTLKTKAVHPAGLKAALDARTGTESAAGLLQAATAAETLAGTLRTKAVTPYGLNNLGKSLGLSGYARLPGGLILQWARPTVSWEADITFPIAFPTAAFGVIGMDAASEKLEYIASFGIKTGSLTRTGVTLFANRDDRINYIAIGH